MDIEHLSRLARIKLTDAEKEKFQAELGKILAHFEELKKLDTENVAPMTGGTELQNVFREDFARAQSDNTRVVSSFPEKQGEYLKVPKVFDI